MYHRIRLCFYAFLFFLIVLSEPSCKFDNLEELQPDVCDTVAVSYQSNVVPILTDNCYGCHAASIYQFLGGGNRLEGYSHLKEFADNGKLICAIKHTACAKPMPSPDRKLADSLIHVIDAWICKGAPDN